MNQTLLNLVRTMLHAENMEKKFWAEASETAFHIGKRLFSRSVPGGTTTRPRWHGTSPDLSHCQIFGATCYYIVPKSKVKKLYPR